MDSDTRQTRWLLAAAALLCALIIGYNVLFVPQVTLTAVVYTDVSSNSSFPLSSAQPVSEGEREAYEPEPVAALVNINTADAQQLETLPNIGPVTAQRIIEYRKMIGGFQSTEELMQVDGIGEKTFSSLQALVTTGE